MNRDEVRGQGSVIKEKRRKIHNAMDRDVRERAREKEEDGG